MLLIGLQTNGTILLGRHIFPNFKVIPRIVIPWIQLQILVFNASMANEAAAFT